MFGQSSLKEGRAGCICTTNLINTKSNTAQGLEMCSILAMLMLSGFPDHAEMLTWDEDILLKQVGTNTLLYYARHIAYGPRTSIKVLMPRRSCYHTPPNFATLTEVGWICFTLFQNNEDWKGRVWSHEATPQATRVLRWHELPLQGGRTWGGAMATAPSSWTNLGRGGKRHPKSSHVRLIYHCPSVFNFYSCKAERQKMCTRHNPCTTLSFRSSSAAIVFRREGNKFLSS